MCNCGLEISNCWFVDIPYSTNNRVRQELLHVGFPSDQMVEPFNDPIDPYAKRQIERVEYILSNLINRGRSKILVIDDGGYLIRTLNHILPRNKKMVWKFKERGTYLVEQTTRGHKYLNTKAAKETLKLLNIPAVSIARTFTKCELESPFIGASVSQKMIEALHRHGQIANLGKIFILGFGYVGQATAHELSKLDIDEPMDVYDVQCEKLERDITRIGANALKVFPKDKLYDTVIGCTGKAAVHTAEQLKILADDAVLVSGSSAAIEFNREKFVDLAYRSEKDNFFIIEPEKTRKQGLHTPVRMSLYNRKFSFLNAGFPINFDGSVECLPSLIIQPTHGMLVAAASETFKQKPGFSCLKNKYDKWFYEKGLKWIDKYANGASS
jgi:hypothetical protein